MAQPDVSVSSAGKTARPAWRRWLIRVAGFLALLYLLGCLMFSYSGLQNILIFPGSATQGKPDARVHPTGSAELVTLKTRDGQTVVGIFGKAVDAMGNLLPDASHLPTILYFYGNGSCMAQSTGEFEYFRHQGANVLLCDYVGYGMSSGTPSEEGCYATADAGYEYLLSREDVDGRKIVAAGWSLGAAVAIDLASRRQVAGLITVSAFTSMPDMGRRYLPFVPTSLLLHYRFNNLQKIAGLRCPMLIMHGTDDHLVPAAMSRRLAGAAGGPVTRLELPGAGHNDVFESGGEKLWAAVKTFVSGLQ